MSSMGTTAPALAGPMGKLAWSGIIKCRVQYRKLKATPGNGLDDTTGVIGRELDKKLSIIGELFDRLANKLGAKFVQGDCEYSISFTKFKHVLITFLRQCQTCLVYHEQLWRVLQTAK
jgi:hypothetical protein